MTATWIPTTDFGARLRLVRYQLHLTVDEIARECDIASATWSTWENGSKPRDILTAVQKIVQATGVDRDWLLWGNAFTGSVSDRYSDGQLSLDFRADCALAESELAA